MPSDHSRINLREIEDSVGGRVPGLSGRFGRKHLDSRDLGVSLFSYEPGTRGGGHSHREQEEAYLVVSGSGRMRVGDTVLDVACGPGNTTRTLLDAVGAEGLAVGVDSSPTMLARAVSDTTPGSPVGYVRADAVDLPFGDATFDAISCYGALYLMDDPIGALREMIRLLAPGGRIAVLTTCVRGPAPVRRLGVAASRVAPLRLFDVDEVTDVLREAGLQDVTRNVSAASQTVGGRRP